MRSKKYLIIQDDYSFGCNVLPYCCDYQFLNMDGKSDLFNGNSSMHLTAQVPELGPIFKLMKQRKIKRPVMLKGVRVTGKGIVYKELWFRPRHGTHKVIKLTETLLKGVV
jgi:hypothetical protein